MPDAITPAAGAAPSITLDGARQARADQQSASGPAQELDGEVFLKLLVTQLQNQDPSSPMDTNQMVSQAAQLSMTETLNSISATLQTQSSAHGLATASSLIGRIVDWSQDGATGTGTATGAVFRDGQAFVEIDGGATTLTLDQITSLAARPTADLTTDD